MITKVIKVMQDILIIGRDLNTILNPTMDSPTPDIRPGHSIAPLLHKYELYDILCCFHGSEKNFTFLSAAHSSYSHIDYFFTDKGSLQNVLRTDLGTISWSDYAPITLEFDEKFHNSPLHYGD